LEEDGQEFRRLTSSAPDPPESQESQESQESPQSPRSVDLPDPPPGCTLYQIAWVFYLVVALVAVVWVGWREGTIPTSLFLHPQTWIVDLGLGLGAGLLLLVLWEGVRRWVAAARELEDALAALLTGLPREEALALAFLSGFAEELFFRGAMQGSFGVVVTTLLFAMLHRGPGPAFRIWPWFALLAGALFGGLQLWRGNLLAPVAAHILVNAVGLWRFSMNHTHKVEDAENPPL
jgi:membrane protease YdiL (CAAX protease family)